MQLLFENRAVSRAGLSLFCWRSKRSASHGLGRGGIELVLNSRVTGVRKCEVDVVNAKTNATEVIPFGACVWSTGVAMHPLVKKLQVGSAPKGLNELFIMVSYLVFPWNHTCTFRGVLVSRSSSKS